MKFTIEIYSMGDDGEATRLLRTTVNAINPLGARKEARLLLAAWKKRGANSAHILNAQEQIVYSWTE